MEGNWEYNKRNISIKENPFDVIPSIICIPFDKYKFYARHKFIISSMSCGNW